MKRNSFIGLERLAWEQMHRLSGRTRAIYKQGEREVELDVVICSPTAGSLVFGAFTLYDNSYIFEVDKNQLGDIVPKTNDTIKIHGKTYTVDVAEDGPCWMDVGAHGVTIRIHTRTNR